MRHRALTLLTVAWLALPAGADVLPDAFADGWQRDGQPRTFTGPELYGHINGGSEVFLELGFDHLLVQRYRGPDDRELIAEVYVMADPVASLGIYLLRCGALEQPAAGLAHRNTVSPHQLSMLAGNVYATIASPSGTDDGARAMGELAAALALPEAGVEADPFAALPASERVPGSLRIVRGEFTLADRFTLGEGDVLQLARGVTAVAADLRAEDGTVQTVLVALYADPAAAVAAFAHLKANLDVYMKAESVDGRSLRLRDYREQTVLVELDGARITVRYDRP